MKLLEQSTCINLCNLGLGKDFLEMTLKLHGTKDKIHMLDFIKILKSLCSKGQYQENKKTTQRIGENRHSAKDLQITNMHTKTSSTSTAMKICKSKPYGNTTSHPNDVQMKKTVTNVGKIMEKLKSFIVSRTSNFRSYCSTILPNPVNFSPSTPLRTMPCPSNITQGFQTLELV